MIGSMSKVERLDFDCPKSFEEQRSAFEKKVPAGNLSVLNELVASRASAREIEGSVQEMVGDLGLMVLGRIDQGPLVSLLGKPKKVTTYLLGNPLLANRMFEQHPGIGHYAPLRATLYEDYQGKTHFTFDRPSTVLGQFKDLQAQEVGKILDEKMVKLAEFLAAGGVR